MGKHAEIKTKPTGISVSDFIDNIEDDKKREDTRVILKMMKKLVKEEPKIWGSTMIGFGQVRYKSPATGREVDWFKIGFSPRKTNFSLHLVMDIKKQADLLSKLGKHKTGMGCLYIKKLADIDLKVLEQLIIVALKK
jgi:Domain of unknown function (DU1801)